ncbi:MAG: Uma2 family endonuclease [Pseudanabaenaceae cyanobacterium SKYGB_i_bin29]|nr:Uma2 family endonuclease [Pseudanabaenaceae cyanobacterium SKYG29]MDW8420237.1 Uma2 family endonuclease [Pseudanabaenaceae cyanobacterium SKYGB_i_bin29]
MTITPQTKPIVYPDSDGQPMADNTKQFRWIVTIKENLEYLFRQDERVFVAGDLLWYPVEGRPDIRTAPDVMVVFGRPKGDRGSYKQWQEDNIAPQVVFEVLSAGNTIREMNRKLFFYNHYGVEEYYIYDPDSNQLEGLQRQGEGLRQVEEINGWVSPRLGIRFELTAETLNLYDPQGEVFLTPVQIRERAEQERHRAEQERLRAEQEAQRAEQERLRAEQEAQRAGQEKLRADRFAAKLRELGLDPDTIV